MVATPSVPSGSKGVEILCSVKTSSVYLQKDGRITASRAGEVPSNFASVVQPPEVSLGDAAPADPWVRRHFTLFVQRFFLLIPCQSVSTCVLVFLAVADPQEMTILF